MILSSNAHLVEPTENEIEIVPSLSAEELDQGDYDDDNDETGLYRLRVTIGDGAEICHSFLRKSGPIGDLARAVEVLLEGLSQSESRMLVSGAAGVSRAVASILAAGQGEG